ncbi:MAG TPA: orotidine-5'-phosphate decarboxylase [Actinomycetota bacterium]|nr:orotidine-5'-phosphate decarboxylase [Actinomycetota bacterium]
MSPDTKLCIALDGDVTDVRRLASSVCDEADILKIGLTAFVSGGADLVTEIAASAPVFLDLKLHDIPAQVEGAADAAAKLGVKYLTVHAAGGPEMIKAAVAAAGESVDILAVTMLTSLDDPGAEQIGFRGSVGEAVVRLADIAVAAGAAGVVCSPREVTELRSRLGPLTGGGPLLVVPGIRAAGGVADDQRRTMSGREAARAGADVIVVGRPITAAADPVAAARGLRDEISQTS